MATNETRLWRLWHDPVWSKVIAAGITGFIGAIGLWGANTFDWGKWGTAISSLIGLVGLISVVFLLLQRLYRVSLKWRRRFMTILTSFPVIGIVLFGLLFIVCVVYQLADNRRANSEIQETLSLYVLPRHLTEQQITTIGDYLLQYDPQQVKMVVIKNTEEASSYRADIQRALMRGAWEIISIDYSDDVREGVSAQFVETQESSQRRPDPKHPKPNEVLQKAFQQAHVQWAGIGTASGVAVTSNSVTISIGRRRMDDGDLIGKKQMQERARRILEGEDVGRL
jgi:hypothetical protein